MCVECHHRGFDHDGPAGKGCRITGCNCNRYSEENNVNEEHEHTYLCDGPEGCPEQSEVKRAGNVGELIDGRVDVYGDPAVVFVRQAQIFSAILGVEVQPWQVALLMVGYKLVRTSVTPDYSDNSDDIDGYLDIFKTIIGDDMVHARDTKDYIAQGGAGARSVKQPKADDPTDWPAFAAQLQYLAKPLDPRKLESGDELSREEMQRLVYLCNKAGSFQTQANRELFDYIEQMFKARLT
jgi:hypothetical protein